METAANTFTENSFPTGTLLEAGFVLEVLRIKLEIESIVDQGANDGLKIAIYERSRAAMPHLNDSGVFAVYDFESEVAGGSGVSEMLKFHDYDFTDGGGNGIASAQKELFIGIQGVGQTNPQTANVAVLTRVTRVALEELVALGS